MNLTPNRGDCMSVAGVAREVAALRKQPLHPPAIEAGRRRQSNERFPVRLEGGAGLPEVRRAA